MTDYFLTHWQPTAKFETLHVRARMLQSIRTFFSSRDVLEIETPLLCGAATTDVHLHSFASVYRGPDAPDGRVMYLHTSPEFAMKRLVAAGSGAIYQICKVFRQGEAGRMHNPEFTMLEWYRPHYDYHSLMDDVEDLVLTVLREHISLQSAERLSYAQALQIHAGVDAHYATALQLRERLRELNISPVPGLNEHDRDPWLDVMMTHVVQPKLGQGRPTFIYDYPASQAAFARIRPGPPPVGERFELFVNGVELANGFYELTDAEEQRRRFEHDRMRRQMLGLRDVPLDEHLLAALESGMPKCAGVALGFDRLVMLAIGAQNISEVLTFPVDRA